MTVPEKLRLLAKWFDLKDIMGESEGSPLMGTEVQQDLRKIADTIDELFAAIERHKSLLALPELLEAIGNFISNIKELEYEKSDASTLAPEVPIQEKG